MSRLPKRSVEGAKSVKKAAPKKLARAARPPAKTKAKGASRKKRRGLTGGIGILSSIPFSGTTFEIAFNQGLGTTGLYRNPQDGLGYDPNALNAAVATLVNDPKVTLIVSVGGSITEAAALNPSNHNMKNTISIGGGALGVNPGGSGNNFRQRVDLQSFAQHPARIQHLGGLPFNIQKGKICLLSNKNSFMTPTEQPPFTAITKTSPVTIDINENSTAQDIVDAYSDAFTNQIPAGIEAVIVSADPYFTKTMSYLVPIANQWLDGDPSHRRICYPLQEYANAGSRRGQTTLHGPSLFEAYQLLGGIAADILNNKPPRSHTVTQHINHK